MRKPWRIVLGITLTAALAYVIYVVVAVTMWSNTLGPCGMSSGPIFPRAIVLDPDTLEPDHTFFVNGSTIMIAYAVDTASDRPRRDPVLWKEDTTKAVLWAYSFDSVRSHWGLTIENPNLLEEYHSIGFFNGEFMEPADFQFDENWNFEYMCQSPM